MEEEKKKISETIDVVIKAPNLKIRKNATGKQVDKKEEK